MNATVTSSCFRLGPAIVALGAFASSAFGQVIVSTATTAPSVNVVSSFAIADAGVAGYQWRNDSTNGRRDLGEVFFPAAALDLKAITLQLQSSSGAGTKEAAFTLTVFRFSALSPAVTVDEVVGSFSGTIPNATYAANTFITFDITGSNVKLQSGATYGFLLSFDEPAATRAMSFQFVNTANATPLGRRLESANGTTFSVSTTSLEFYIQATPTAVPEPSSAALAGGAVALAAGFVVRRRRSLPL